MDTHASFNENDESIECCKSNITLIVDAITFGKGTLYVAESKLYWKNNANSQVISINYDIMCKFDKSHHPEVHEKPCLEMIVNFNYIPDDIEVGQNEDEKEEELKSIIKLVPDNPECLNEIFEGITCVQPLHNRNCVNDEDEVEGSDRDSNWTDISLSESDEDLANISLSESDEELANISLSESDEELANISLSESDEHLADISLSESDEQEDSDKNSNTSISSTCTQEDQEADAKNGEKENQVNSIKCLDIPHCPIDSLDDNEYSHDSENDDLELNNISSPASYFDISSRAPIRSYMDTSSEFEDDILLQDEKVLINKRKRKFEDLPEQEEKPTKISKLWNFMKYPLQKIISFSTSISENEVITVAIAGKKNFLEPETVVCENNSDTDEENNSDTDEENNFDTDEENNFDTDEENNFDTDEENNFDTDEENNSDTDEENEDTSTNETLQKSCKIM